MYIVMMRKKIGKINPGIPNSKDGMKMWQQPMNATSRTHQPVVQSVGSWNVFHHQHWQSAVQNAAPSKYPLGLIHGFVWNWVPQRVLGYHHVFLSKSTLGCVDIWKCTYTYIHTYRHILYIYTLVIVIYIYSTPNLNRFETNPHPSTHLRSTAPFVCCHTPHVCCGESQMKPGC